MQTDGPRRFGLPAATAGLALLAFALVSCNSHPVSYQPASGAVDRIEEVDPGGGAAVDILWVIDNSASMCQEQDQLRRNFNNFIDKLGGQAVDFHIAVTTTQFVDGRDPVAKPGHIQSQPSPVPIPEPDVFGACLFSSDDQGNQLDGEPPPQNDNGPKYGALRTQIKRAVECTKNPGNYSDLTGDDLTRKEIECALSGGSAKVCDEVQRDISAFRDLFPPRSAYRSVDKVLRSEDYQEGGQLDKDELVRDFSCMSFVGTRGSPDEQGLRAAAKAVSPEMTGGPAELSEESATDEQHNNYDPDGDGTSEYDKNAPNHGFVRKNANFALVFVSDENDCSLEGYPSLREFRSDNPDLRDQLKGCIDKTCYFLSKAQKGGNNPMARVDALKQRFMKNLAQSKGLKLDPSNPEDPETLDPQSILAASIHGRVNTDSVKTPNPYTSAQEQCTEQGSEYVSRTCVSGLGEAFSGDRYAAFIRKFERFYPPPPNAQGQIPGELCRGNLQSTIEAIGDFIEPGQRTCLPSKVLPCESNADCPPFKYANKSCSSDSDCQQTNQQCIKGQCTRTLCTKVTSGRFCRSAIQLQLTAPEGTENPKQELKDSGYCIEKSINAEGLKRGCIVKRSKYDWTNCKNGDGIQLEWSQPVQVKIDLQPFDLKVRYTEQISDEGASSSDTGASLAPDVGSGAGASDGG